MQEDGKKPAKKPAKASGGFTAEERAAMKARVQEEKARTSKEEGVAAALAAIAAMPDEDRVMAQRLHAIITASAPALSAKTWYGMPAYAKDDKIICFFQPASKFKVRYSTLGFNDSAHLDDGAMWPVAFALTELTAAGEAKIAALVKQAMS